MLKDITDGIHDVRDGIVTVYSTVHDNLAWIPIVLAAWILLKIIGGLGKIPDSTGWTPTYKPPTRSRD